MIKSLKIENFIIVDNLEVEFSNGLQVLSGETGAGKSIIAGAINIVLAGQLTAGILRNEQKPATLEAVFDIDPKNKPFLDLLKKYEIAAVEEEIFIQREIGTSYRSKSFINGRRVSLDIIAEFRNVLLDFHSQRDQQKLFDQNYQLEVLDIYGNLLEQRQNFESEFRQLESRIKHLQSLQKREKENTERIRLYEYQVQEIDALQLQQDEEHRLQAELKMLSNAEAIINIAAQMERIFYEDDNSVYDTLSLFLKQLSVYRDDNELITEAVSNVHDALGNLKEAAAKMRELQNVIDLDGVRLENVQERLNGIYSLCSKYKRSVTELIDYRKMIVGEIEEFSDHTEEIVELTKEIDDQIDQLGSAAAELSRKRKKAAAEFAAEIQKNIRELAISDAAVQIRFETLTNHHSYSEKLNGISSNGCDLIEFYFSANQGIKLQPFRIAASGGELSRFLLSIKKILSDRLDSRTIIFDEIDAGIGGKTSEMLAEYIHKIGNYHQVICISHLPQIAAYADRHFAIIKKKNAKFSEVDVNLLTEKHRQKEIARMLSGSQSELALQHAEELINKSKEREIDG